MPEFSRKPIVAINQVAVDYNSTAQPRAQRYHNKVFHSFGDPEGEFPLCCGIGIIGYLHWQTKSFFKHITQRDNTPPGEVRGKFDTSLVKIAIGSTYPNS